MYIIHRNHRRDINAYEYNDASVTIITDDRTRVRQNPNLYLPNTEKEGAIHLLDEALSNSIDEVTAPDSPGTEIIVSFDEHDKIAGIQDDGRGFPLNKFIPMCEVLDSSAKMGTDNRAYGESGGVHGCGLKLITYMTKWMNITTEREGKSCTLKYVDGIRKETINGKSKDTGTNIMFQYDKRFFSDINITCEDIMQMIQRKAYVSEGAEIIFQGKTKKGQEIIKEYRGLTLRDYMKQFKINSPLVEGSGMFGNSRVSFILGFDTESVDDYQISAYTNNIYNKFGGSHTDGVLDGIASMLREYMYKSYLSDKEKDMKLKAEDFRAGLVGIISLYTLNPKFKGQHKEALDSTDLKNFVTRTVRLTLRQMDTAKLNKLCLIVKMNAKARMASEISKKRVKKDITNAFSNDKIENFIPISKYSTSPFKELFIAEGLSAINAIRSARDKDSQAILSLRGKIENVFDLRPADALKQSTFLDHLVSIFDCGFDKTFDMSKFNYDRINIATDADTDGNEIAAEIAMMFTIFFPDIVKAGRLYRVIPPLYEVKQSGKSIYLSTNRELYTMTQANFAKDHNIYCDDKLTNDDIIQILMRNDKYVTGIVRLSHQYAITPRLCEFIVANMKIGFVPNTINTWNDRLSTIFRFTRAKYLSGEYVGISGQEIGEEYSDFDYEPEFDQDVETMLHISDVDKIYGYSIDGRDDKLSLYQILSIFSKYQPKIVKRFKGLGQMKSDDLKRTVMDRDIRHSIRLTMTDIKDTYNRLCIMHSKKPKYKGLRKKYMRDFKFDLIDIDT